LGPGQILHERLLLCAPCCLLLVLQTTAGGLPRMSFQVRRRHGTKLTTHKNSTQHTEQSIQNTTHNTQHITHSIQHTAHARASQQSHQANGGMGHAAYKFVS
jgi:hypothetical protein